MKKNNGRLKDRILLALDSSPSYGYGLLKMLEQDDHDIMITTLYRWLHQMEYSGLVESEIQSSPYGPSRRVYRVGENGKTRLSEMMKNAIEIVTHFYTKYCHYRIACACKLVPENLSHISGRVLFSSSQRLNEFDHEIVKTLFTRCNGTKLQILGNEISNSCLSIPHRRIKGDLTDIKSRSGRFSLVWLSGVPEEKILPLALSEFRRVLKDDGVLFISSPLTFFDEPKTPSIGAFLRYASTDIFPDGGVREGLRISRIIDEFFPSTCVVEVFPGFALFKATKRISEGRLSCQNQPQIQSSDPGSSHSVPSPESNLWGP
ncbi:MAG: helix-turn-helix transcriptional regulator [Candidatus Thorarchaeota archaeon]|jgi:DNA-binding PadR family transcriptional regulator